MAEDMTPGEVGRTLQRIELATNSLREGFDGWREIVIEVRHQVQENTKDIAAINEERKAESVQRKKDKQLLVTALIAPAVILFAGFGLQIVLTALGVL